MAAPPAAIFPPHETFLLSSRPAASKTIYLDFTGHTTTGTAWFDGGTYVTPAYTIDAGADFSPTELLNIQDIWARVAETFSPFDVNVTTKEPPLDDLRNSGDGDSRWGIRVVIGGDNQWLPGAGGVAYVGSFNWNSDTPTFVFSEVLGSNKFIADAANHEVGHTLGLTHDGRINPAEEYYTGHGTGATGWAPIMGVGYGRQLVQWSRGQYLEANNEQDDLAIITTQNGFGYRPDDHGDTSATATRHIGTDLSGVIERNTDVDVFRFYTSQRAQVQVRPALHGPMLDILAELVDGSGTVIRTSNPADGLDASFNEPLLPGAYYVRVTGTGKGDPLGTGYTDYGSLGQYTISVVADAKPVILSVEDRVGTKQGVVANGGRTDDRQPIVTGTGIPGDTVTLTAGGLTLGTGTVSPTGTWAITVAVVLADGGYQLTVTDSLGAVSERPFAIFIDTQAPATPAIVTVIDDVGFVQGILTNAGSTDDTRLRFEGTAEPRSLVTLSNNGSPIGTATTNGSGQWAFTTSELAPGQYAFSASAADEAGNLSGTSPLFEIMVDTSPPPTPAIVAVSDDVAPNTGNLASGGVTNDQAPTIFGTSLPGSTVRLLSGSELLGTAPVDSNGNWSLTPADLFQDGPYSLTAVTVNAIGVSGAASTPFTLLVDTRAATATITRSGNRTLKSGDSATVSVSLSEPSTDFTALSIDVTGGVLTAFVGSGRSYSATFTPEPGFAGSATISVAAGVFTDAAGNLNQASTTLSMPVDAAAPTLAIARSGTATLASGQTATITFTASEPISAFTAADLVVTGGTITGFTGSGSSYSTIFTPSRGFAGSATISIAIAAFADAAGNSNQAAASLSIPVDTVSPTLELSRPGDAPLLLGESTLVSFVLSEPSMSFVAADVVVTGGTLAGFTGSGASYSAAFTPTPGFTGSANISVPAAAFTDTAGNPNQTSPTLTFPIDASAPTVQITRFGSGPLTTGGSALISFVLSEPSINFATGDIAVSGGTLASFTGSGTTYSATFTPTPGFAGSAAISIPATAFTDAAGNQNLASDVLSMAVQAPAPTLQIMRDGREPIAVGNVSELFFHLSTSSANFTASDIEISGGSLSGFTGSGSIYSAIFTPTAGFAGSAIVLVPVASFTDLTGVSNTASATLVLPVDTLAPTIQIARSGNESLPIRVTTTISFTLSEPAIDFVATDITVSGGSLSNFRGSGRSYAATFTPEPGFAGSATISVAAGVFTDAAGNLNQASTTLSMPVDAAAPTLAIARSGAATLASGQTATITFTASEPISAFTAADLVVTGGTITGFTGSGSSYSTIFTPSRGFAGAATISIPVAVFADAAGNSNQATASLSIPVDTASPTLELSRPGNTPLLLGESTLISFALSEPSISFVVADVVVSGGTLAGFTGSGASYSAAFTPTPGFSGSANISVPAAAFTDTAGNPNQTSSTLTFPIDASAPTVQVTRFGSGPLTTGGSALISFVLSEPSINFAAGDIAVSGGTLSSFTGSGTTYSATFTPAPGFAGAATISIPATAFTDAAGNQNQASDLLSMAVDLAAPTLQATRSGNGSLSIGQTAVISFTASEPIALFAATDLLVTGGTVTGFTGSGSNYSAIFTPLPGFTGSATISIPAAAFTDAAGNPNQAALLLSLPVEATAPRITGFRTSPASATLGIGESIVIEAAFSEPVNPGGSVPVGLNTGAQIVLVVDATGQTAHGSYSPQAGEATERLDVSSISASNGVFDPAGNQLSTLLPAVPEGLLARSAIRVDARARLVDNGGYSTNPLLIRDLGNPAPAIPIRFSTDVTGVSLASLVLTVDGRQVSSRGARLQGSGAAYVLQLPPARVNQIGIYRLSVVPGAIRAVSNGVAATETVSLHWGFGRSIGMVPSAPTGVAPTQLVPSGRQTALVLGWQAPAGNGGGPVTHYLVEHRLAGTTRWIPLRGRIAAPATTAIIPSVTPNRAYEFRVAAVNAAGIGAYAQSGPINLLGLATIQAITPATPTASRPSSRR